MTLARSADRNDRGWVTASVAILATSLIFVAGLVIDGGRRITTYMRAGDLAANAARAAAQSADPSSLYSGEEPVLDLGMAAAAAAQFLADAGHPGSMTSIEVDGDTVTVEVTLSPGALILPDSGGPVSADAAATAQRGVDAPTGGP